MQKSSVAQAARAEGLDRESDRGALLRFLEAMDRVNRAIQGTSDLERMMSDVLDVVLDLLGCDRAFLMSPCDPDAPAWSVPMERERPAYPGAHRLGGEISMDPEVSRALRLVLAADGPVRFGPGTPNPLPADVAERFGFRCSMAMAVHPRVGKPWQFGVHQCSHVREWTAAEQRLLEEIGRRIADGLTGLLAHQDLRASEARFRARESFIRNIFDSVDEGFIVVDRDYRIVSANRAFCTGAAGGGGDVEGRKCHEVSHDLDRPCHEVGHDCAVRRTFETGAAHAASHVHLDAHGTRRFVELRAYPVADASGAVTQVIETISDVTERRRLEDQLGQAQKMEAIGTLAGGVAHDFNNILTGIIGYANALQEALPATDPLQESVEQIVAASERAAQLTRGLLAFGRKQIINPRPTDLNEVVRNVDRLLRRLIGEDIELRTQLSPGELVALADGGQVEQVLMNLAANARDAMPEGGALTITTSEVLLDREAAAAHGAGRPGRYAAVSVSDTGTGMDEATRQKVFEPFFTTKELGKGTGLGLAIVYGIVKQHGGGIEVSSEPGDGATFRVLLPLVSAPVERRRPRSFTPVVRGSETVLLAEDDAMVRAMVARVLTGNGYRVIEALDGADALEKYAAHRRDVDMLVLDVIMPRRSGREVYDAVRAERPEMRALFLSGYTADIIHKKGIFDEGLQFVPKPVTPLDLLRRIRGILDAPG